MSSVTKTLDLLTLFSANRPEIGLSQLCRLAGRDKATTYRHLQALEAAGFVEQNPQTKQYRLGPALLGLAQTREATVPREAGAIDALRALSDATGETAHAAVLSGTVLYALANCESPQHGTRVIIDIQTYPLHATASGLCALAYGPDTLLPATLGDLRRYTDRTVTDAAALNALVSDARRTGFARSDGSLESDAHSLATPLFDHTERFAGAVSVATVATRMTPTLEATIRTGLVAASRIITRNWGGAIPPRLNAVWAQALPQSQILDTAS